MNSFICIPYLKHGYALDSPAQLTDAWINVSNITYIDRGVRGVRKKTNGSNERTTTEVTTIWLVGGQDQESSYLDTTLGIGQVLELIQTAQASK